MLPRAIGAICLSLCALLVEGSGSAVIHDYFRYAPKVTATPKVPAKTIALPLDHFGTNKQTFNNRYWVNSEYYKDGGPVFVYDVGEADAENATPLLSVGTSGSDTVAEYAQRFGGLVIVWEHRYYGKSLPPNQPTGNYGPDDLAEYYQYLTVENALEDMVVFAKTFKLDTMPGKDLRPNSVPWVFFGGSYPGMRTAFLRMRNPEVAFASYSSSAPVQIQEVFWQYYVAIERILVDAPGYQGCAADLHAFANAISDIITRKDVRTAEAILTGIFPGNWEPSTSNSARMWNDRAQVLVSAAGLPFRDFQDVGLSGYLGAFCEAIIDPEFTSDQAATAADFQNGIVKLYGLNNALTIYMKVLKAIYRSMKATSTALADVDAESVNVRMHKRNNNLRFTHTYDNFRPATSDTSTTTGTDTTISTNTTNDGYGGINDDTAWAYQTCTELGFFQTSGGASRPTNLVPAINDRTFWINSQCVPLFGNFTSKGVDAKPMNEKYGGWKMTTSNTFHINSQYDPWRGLSVSSDVDPSSPGNNFTTSPIPAVNAVLPQGQIFGMEVANGVHCSDFEYNVTMSKTKWREGSHLADVVEAHRVFGEALGSWLPAYTKFEAVATSTIVTATATGVSGATATAKSAAAPLADVGRLLWCAVVVIAGLSLM